MSATLIDENRVTPATQQIGTASTSIRVSVATRDALATQAKTRGLSLTAYLDRVAYALWRQEALHELRRERLAAFQDPVFVAEMREWEDAEDDLDPGDSQRPEHNGGG